MTKVSKIVVLSFLTLRLEKPEATFHFMHFEGRDYLLLSYKEVLSSVPYYFEQNRHNLQDERGRAVTRKLRITSLDLWNLIFMVWLAI